MNVLLTYEQIFSLIIEVPKRRTGEDWGDYLVEVVRVVADNVALAQAKKILEWLESPCPHTAPHYTLQPRSDCYQCWQDFKQEVEGWKEMQVEYRMSPDKLKKGE